MVLALQVQVQDRLMWIRRFRFLRVRELRFFFFFSAPPLVSDEDILE